MDNNTAEYTPQTMPYSPEAEQAVLGAIIKDNGVFDKVLEHLRTPEYFYVGLHRQIYAAMQEMMDSGKAVDFVTLLGRLQQNNTFDEATGKTYLFDLVENCPSVSNAGSYAQIIEDKYHLRRLIEAAREMIDDATSAPDSPEIIIDSAEQKLFDIRGSEQRGGLERISSVILQTFDRLDSLNRDADESMKPVSTGIGDLDRVITGLNRSDLIILAARPGMGKTSFALNIARNVAVTGKKTVAFFSLEMSREQLASRLLSSEAQVGGTKLRTGRISDEEWQRLIPASDVLKNSDIFIDDTPGLTITEMKSKLRRLRKVDLVVVDYLQLMSGTRRVESRVNEISEITRNLKILAKELNVPVITLSQLSRASEQRPDHRPQLSDLRDSGSIEQDADIVLFLYREGYYDKDSGDENAAPSADMNSGECIVAKNRHGEMSTVKLHWQGEFMRFTNVETRYG
ncbi:MAG TPA: replicative DNA helicase [Ruminococcaceae bacterium]|nr:replicative DNA helicase [Oscillospiraceae bacterium]